MSIESRSNQYGTVFEHWQINKMLGSGSGGNTAVFRLIRNDSFQESCALKVINLIEESGSFDGLPPFRQKEYLNALEYSKQKASAEVKMMLRLRGNSNIADYLDHKFVNWSDGNKFGCDLLIRMELLKDLRSLIRDDVFFGEEDILKIGRDISSALVLCHTNGILHRDIKPENIMVNSTGNYKLADFGISRILDSAHKASASTGVGTREYAAPEQLSGSYDKRVDIYSLGLVLYELSNRNLLPFADTRYVSQEAVLKRLSGAPLPRPKDASDKLWEIIQKACAYKAEDRYATAQDLLEALCQIGGPVVPNVTGSVKPSKGFYETTTAAASKGSYSTTPASPLRAKGGSYNTVPAESAAYPPTEAAAPRSGYSTEPAFPHQVGGASYNTVPAESTGYPAKNNRSGNGLMAVLIAIACVSVLLLIAAGALLFFRSKDSSDGTSVGTSAAQTSAPSYTVSETTAPETTAAETTVPETTAPAVLTTADRVTATSIMPLTIKAVEIRTESNKKWNTSYEVPGDCDYAGYVYMENPANSSLNRLYVILRMNATIHDQPIQYIYWVYFNNICVRTSL